MFLSFSEIERTIIVFSIEFIHDLISMFLHSYKPFESLSIRQSYHNTHERLDLTTKKISQNDFASYLTKTQYSDEAVHHLKEIEDFLNIIPKIPNTRTFEQRHAKQISELKKQNNIFRSTKGQFLSQKQLQNETLKQQIEENLKLKEKIKNEKQKYDTLFEESEDLKIKYKLLQGKFDDLINQNKYLYLELMKAKKLLKNPNQLKIVKQKNLQIRNLSKEIIINQINNRNFPLTLQESLLSELDNLKNGPIQGRRYSISLIKTSFLFSLSNNSNYNILRQIFPFPSKKTINNTFKPLSNFLEN